jgi:hypothetical protein
MREDSEEGSEHSFSSTNWAGVSPAQHDDSKESKHGKGKGLYLSPVDLDCEAVLR